MWGHFILSKNIGGEKEYHCFTFDAIPVFYIFLYYYDNFNIPFCPQYDFS